MIFETVLGYIGDLRSRWTGVRDALTALSTEMSAPGYNYQRGVIDTVATNITNYLLLIDTQRSDLEALTDIVGFLTKAQSTFANHSTQFSTVNSSLTTSNLLQGLLASPDDTVAATATVVQARLSDLQQLIRRSLQEIEEIRSPEGGRANLAGLRGSVENMSAYPVLTQETRFLASPASPGTRPSGTATLGQVVEGTLRDVLGWRPKVSDPKGFVAALTQSFTCKDVDGHTECVYTPRTYAVQVQADLGAVTGAQASIYARAKVALDQSTLILDRLYALDLTADPQEVEGIRATVRSGLTELVNELGIEGGPRVQRVDSFFDQLRGGNNPSYNPAEVQGQLRLMRDVFGLTSDKVFTIEEEQNQTDYLTLVDYVNSLKQSWDTNKPFFDRSTTAQPFLGTQLVLVSRVLAVIAELVQEAYFALDSVFLGPAERQTIELTFPGGAPMFVAELLAWVDRFASEEGPRLVQDGGKVGVRAFFPTIDRLFGLVQGARIPPQDPNRVPAGYRTARVQRALEELAGQLQEAAGLARKFVPGGAV